LLCNSNEKKERGPLYISAYRLRSPIYAKIPIKNIYKIPSAAEPTQVLEVQYIKTNTDTYIFMMVDGLFHILYIQAHAVSC